MLTSLLFRTKSVPFLNTPLTTTMSDAETSLPRRKGVKTAAIMSFGGHIYFEFSFLYIVFN